MKVHKIKLNIEFCDDVYNGIKLFEIRKNDRDYQKGDKIMFTAFSDGRIANGHPINGEIYEITYVLNGWGIEKGYIAFGIRKLAEKANKVVESFLDVDLSDLSFPNITIYYHPEDMPNKVVARLFDIEKPTDICIVRDTVEQCRKDINMSGFHWMFHRKHNDATCIVETWIN